MELLIVGAGLAGSEAAWQAANRGVQVCIVEMRPAVKTEAHLTDHCAELVCSNSFRSDDAETTAIGLLHEEMRRCDSLIMKTADAHKVPAGTALAVDRVGFSEAITTALRTHPNIRFEPRELSALPSVPAIIATGPLTSSSLAQSILDAAGMEYLAFFDAIAPIIHTDSIDMSKAWFQSRYDKIGPGGNGKDYINCPMDREQYENFIDALLAGEKTEFKEWEKNTPYFNGCLPIEVMAQRGRETLRFGPMKPVGLTNPHAPDVKAHAVVQLRQDNKLGTLYNIVGFQTKLKWAEQTRIFRTIPGLENAEFAKLGGIHRNTFINSPKLLDDTLRFKPATHLRFAGQITGVEGYVESAACGLMAGMFFTHELQGTNITLPAPTTAMGALLHHITGGANTATFQPMNVNFGLFPPLGKCRKADRPRAYTSRALADIAAFANPASSQAA